MAKRSGKLARRYARALLQAAKSEFSAGEAMTEILKLAVDLAQFAEIFSKSSELQHALLSPMFSRSGRAQALQALAQQAGLPELTKRALNLLFERDRIGYLPEISQAFSEIANAEAQITEVEVVTAQTLEESERVRVETTLQKCIAGKPRFHWIVKAEILGGMIVRYDGKIIDGSVSGRLSRIERELAR